jgi:hypothetical protein
MKLRQLGIEGIAGIRSSGAREACRVVEHYDLQR